MSSDYRAVPGLFCTGVAVVTTRDEGTPHSFTCQTGVAVVTTTDEGTPHGFAWQAFAALSQDPPLVLVCACRNSRTASRIRSNGEFCVNILAEGQEHLALRFAGAEEDRFRGAGHDRTPSGAPRLDDGVAWIDCRASGRCS